MINNIFFTGLRNFGSISNIEGAQGGTHFETFEVWVKDKSKLNLAGAGFRYWVDPDFNRVVVSCVDMAQALRAVDLINEAVEDFSSRP